MLPAARLKWACWPKPDDHNLLVLHCNYVSVSYHIKSRWRHNWKSAQVVNSHLVCNPTIRQLGFDLPRQQWPLRGTVFARNRDTAVPAKGNGDLQTLICVLVARSRRCPTLSNPVLWQNWMVVYLGYTLQIKMLFRGWPITGNDTHTRRRNRPLRCQIKVRPWNLG